MAVAASAVLPCTIWPGSPARNSFSTYVVPLAQLNEAATPPSEVEHLLVPAVRSNGQAGPRELLLAGSDNLEHALWLSEHLPLNVHCSAAVYHHRAWRTYTVFSAEAFHKATLSSLPEDGYVPSLEGTAHALPVSNGDLHRGRPGELAWTPMRWQCGMDTHPLVGESVSLAESTRIRALLC